MTTTLSYKDSGVDTEEGARAVTLMKEHVQKTFNKDVLTGIGGFGSLYKPNLSGMDEPVLVAGTDGVGTKLKIAIMMDQHDTVGQDLVAMCVNDVLCQGAKPLFFLDYIATGKVGAEKIAELVGGIAEGCLIGGLALVGGETAEMPGFYGGDDYDMAGFAVGIVDESQIIDGKNIEKGDAIIGIPSSGIHSNGFSLVRKVFFEKAGFDIHDTVEGLQGSLGETLLTPTRIYTKQIVKLLSGIPGHEPVRPAGLVHLTGGGWYENIPRILPEGLGVDIEKGSWDILPIFHAIAKYGNVSETDMFSTFNMGIGMMLFVKPSDVCRALAILGDIGEAPALIGEVVVSNQKVVFSDAKG